MSTDESLSARSSARRWQRIEDLPETWSDLCREDLRAVQRQWIADRKLIRDEEKIEKFQEELALHWAIETGIIERLYTADRGVTVQIAKAGMEALGQFHARGLISRDARALITDQREALEMVMDLVGGTRELTTSYVKELHHRLTLSQNTCKAIELPSGREVDVPLLKGAWKRQPNNPLRPDGSIYEYCPPELVQEQMDRMLDWHRVHDGVCPEVEAAWLHHRFTRIHPFQDGNGRVARALTSAVFLKGGYLVLVVRDNEHRDRYFDALEAADAGDLRPLVDLFADIQIGDLNEAIRSLRELRGAAIPSVSRSLAERAKRSREAAQAETSDLVERLVEIATLRLEEAAAEMRRAFGKERVIIETRILRDSGSEDARDYWKWQIVETARHHGYFAQLDRPKRWVGLRFSLPDMEREDARLIVSFHAVGRAADLQAVTAFLTGPLDRTADVGRWENEVVSEAPFKFGTVGYGVVKIEERFRSWLDATIGNGLSVWGEGL